MKELGNRNGNFNESNYQVDLSQLRKIEVLAALTNLRVVVHRWPHVPTAAKRTDRTAKSISASSITRKMKSTQVKK